MGMDHKNHLDQEFLIFFGALDPLWQSAKAHYPFSEYDFKIHEAEMAGEVKGGNNFMPQFSLQLETGKMNCIVKSALGVPREVE